MRRALELPEPGEKLLQCLVGALQVRGIFSSGERLDRAELHHSIHLRRVLHRIQNRSQAE